MKKIFYVALTVATIFLFSSCGVKQDDELSHHHHHNHASEAHQDHDDHDHESEDHDHSGHESHEKPDNSFGSEIVLEPVAAERFGVVARAIEPKDFAESIDISGQILNATGDLGIVAAPTSGIVSLPGGITEGTKVNAGTVIATISAQNMSGGDSNRAAAVAVEAAKRELERLTPLHADGIVTTKELNAARQAYEGAKAAYSPSAASGRAVSPIAGSVTSLLVKSGEFVSAGQPLATVSKNSRLTLRADLPQKYNSFFPTVATAAFRSAASDSWISLDDLNGKLTSSAAASDPSMPGYIPVYFTFDNDGRILPGSFVEIKLIGHTRRSALAVPAEAVIEQQGKYFVYVKVDEHGYEKRLVTLGNNNGSEVEVISGISEGDNVVCEGAMIVKLAESSGAVPEGHSHNH